MFWVRVGFTKDYKIFDTLSELSNYLSQLDIGPITHWLMGERTGCETVNYRGIDYISMYRGNRAGNIVSALLPDERIQLEEGLVDAVGV